MNKNADLLFELLPQGYNSKNKSTGVTSVLMTDRKTLQDVFYTKSEISKLKEGEVVTKAKRPVNLEIQKKIKNPGTDKILEVFGITERDKPNLYKKDTIIGLNALRIHCKDLTDCLVHRCKYFKRP